MLRMTTPARQTLIILKHYAVQLGDVWQLRGNIGVTGHTTICHAYRVPWRGMTVFALSANIRVRSHITDQMSLRLGVQRACSKDHIALRKGRANNSQRGNQRG